MPIPRKNKPKSHGWLPSALLLYLEEKKSESKRNRNSKAGLQKRMGDKMTDIQHQTPSIWKKIWKNANLLSCHIPFQPSIIGKGSTYLREDEDPQGFTISVVPTPSVFIYQLWSKFHRVFIFNKSNGFKNGFAHGTHRSFEIEKDYKERLQKVYRHSPPVSIVASSMFQWLWFPLSPWWNSPSFKPVGIGFPPKELYAGAASRLDHALEGDHHS